MAEIMSVLFYRVMRYSVKEPKHPSNDRFILSKGHAAPILYAAWAEAGLFPVSDLMSLRKIDSDLEGHPTPRLSCIDVDRDLGKAFYRTYCLKGGWRVHGRKYLGSSQLCRILQTKQSLCCH